eukprot:TRINITY_DN20466_c0_g1_i1.p1 TRINITY_DN20466_c0_g1~~TRINITY_DN20466_c0_g1_i1.p1  ORF type:complete len:417 (+),score=142.67 TRINITY_DN20466_c0_g1_i1:69-1319(+)
MNRKRLLDGEVMFDVDAADLAVAPAIKRTRKGAPEGSEEEAEESDSGEDSAPPCPLTIQQELFRSSRVKWLRGKLAKECRAQGAKTPLLSYERWSARSSLTNTGDVLIPSGTPDPMLAKDLARGGISNAEKIGDKMLKFAAQASTLMKEFVPQPDEKGDGWAVWTADKFHRIDLHVGELREYQSINKDHFNKLWDLYTGGEDTGDFNRDVFLLLCRYTALGGHGYQAGLVADAFDLLHRDLQVTCECFASPLNCRYKRFCSAFPDTDAVFGSLGSFFNFHPRYGSYEANPPFVPETMTECVRHVEALLGHKDAKALSFVVIVPAWTDVRMWKQLSRSPYKRASFIVAAQGHSFTDGAQHYRVEHHRPSSYDSGVFILQNDAGSEEFPVPETLQERLTKAMRGDCAQAGSRENFVLV